MPDRADRATQQDRLVGRAVAGTGSVRAPLEGGMLVTVRDFPSVSVAGRRLLLEPLRVDHAIEMAPLLDDARLYAFIGGEPPSEEQLGERYRHPDHGASRAIPTQSG